MAAREHEKAMSIVKEQLDAEKERRWEQEEMVSTLREAISLMVWYPAGLDFAWWG
jgi:hypothetical protein